MKQYKSIAQQATDIDEKSNTVVVYYAAFGNVDNGGDMIMPNAFAKTIQERGPQGKDLIYHFKNHEEAISKPKELIADSYGLKAIVSFPNTTKGRDTIEEYKFGMWKYHSIRYSTVRQQKSKAANELHELKLYEGGHVTWPMNEAAITESVDLKAMQDFINKSNATDEAIQLMQKLLQEFTELKALITEPPKGTLPSKKELQSIFDLYKP